MGFLQRNMRSVNFVDVSIQLQVEVSEENPSVDSNIAPEEHPNHPHLEEIGILVGEVYDEKIIEECLHMGRNSINELLVNLN